MTRKSRSKKNIENKITELYIRLHKRQTGSISRRQNLKHRLEFFKNLLQEIHAQESTSSNSDLTSQPESLSVTSGE
jgi:ABC-type phosphate/phosphonate transport system ATPase subunit